MKKSEFRKTGYIETEKLESLEQMIENSATRYGDKAAYRYYKENQLVDLSYSDLHLKSKLLAKSLYRMNVDHQKIAILASLSGEWMISYFGVIKSGSIALLLHRNMELAQLTNILNQSEVKAIFYDNNCEDIIRMLKPQCETISYYIKLNGPKQNEQMMLEDLFVADEEIEMKKNDVTDVCTIMYTSGTTGKSKGVMLSQKNLSSNVEGALSTVVFTSDDVMFSVLPIYHLYELTCGNLLALSKGITICVNDSLRNIKKNFQTFRPSVMMLVPLFMSSFQKQLTMTLDKKQERSYMKKTKLSRYLGMRARKRLFPQVHAFFGGNVKKFIVGGAAIEPSLIRTYQGYGINVLQGYGISECSPLVSVGSDYWSKVESVGRAVRGCEVKIIDGEICVKGTNVMLGYYKDEVATQEVIRDGWFHTGDLGYLDQDGFLYITGRKKRLIILDNGENVSPEELEMRLNRIPMVAEVVVSIKPVDGVNTIAAEIYPDMDYMSKELEPDQYKEQIRNEIQKENRSLPRYKQIGHVIFREKPFEKTCTNKIKV